MTKKKVKTMSEKKAPEGKGTPVYRCELCGGVTFKSDTKITPGTLHQFLINPPTVIAIEGVPRLVVHGCTNGGFGIASIVGIVPDEVIAVATAPIFESSDDDGEGMVN